MILLNNRFQYGIVGDRLNGTRNSEVYVDSARDLSNFIVTDIGTLRVAKEYAKNDLVISGNIIDVISTTKNYYIAITEENIYCIDETTNDVLQTTAHAFGANVRMNNLGKDNLSVSNGTIKIQSYKIEDRSISLDKTFDKMQLPIRDKRTIRLDLWKISKNPSYDAGVPGSKTLRIVQMSSFVDPLIKTLEGKIFLHNSSIEINRIYTSFNAVVDVDYFTEPADGQIYGIMSTSEKVEDNKQYIVDNTKVTFGALTEDKIYKGEYFTQINGDGDGIFTFGELVEDVANADRMSFYQDRCIVYKGGYLYFSKVSDLGNFRNGVNVDDSFFFQLNPISGKSGDIVGIVSDFGLYVITTVGVYVVGYGGTQLTGLNATGTTVVASDTTATDEYAVKDNSLYFLNKQGVLKAIVLDRTSMQLAFNTITVDKYSSKNIFADVTKVTVNDRDYIACRSKDKKHMYLIEPIEDTGIYRKVKLDLDTTLVNKFIGMEDKIVIDNAILLPSNVNYEKAVIHLNPLNVNNFDVKAKATDFGQAMYTFDNTSMITEIIVKMLNEDKLGIQGLKIANSNITNNPNDKYGLYRLRTSIRIEHGFGIEVFTNHNDKLIELQGVQSTVNPIMER